MDSSVGDWLRGGRRNTVATSHHHFDALQTTGSQCGIRRAKHHDGKRRNGVGIESVTAGRWIAITWATNDTIHAITQNKSHNDDTRSIFFFFFWSVEKREKKKKCRCHNNTTIATYVVPPILADHAPLALAINAVLLIAAENLSNASAMNHANIVRSDKPVCMFQTDQNLSSSIYLF